MSRNKKIAFAICLCFIAFIVLGIIIINSDYFKDKERLNSLNNIGISKIPKTAVELDVDGVSNMFSSTTYIKFKASYEDINSFINSSKGLKNITPENFSPKHMNLPFTEFDETKDNSTDHAYFTINDRYPWFNPTITQKGRKYEIPQNKYAYHGKIFIDDITQTVFIQISRS